MSWKDQELKTERLEMARLALAAKDNAKRASELEKMWEDSAKDYPCDAPPQVNHAASVCKTGNTRYSMKCAVTCAKGYNGKGTRNVLRCRKQGKFGSVLYGEWKGMAVCIGASCGIPPKIKKAKAPIQ